MYQLLIAASTVSQAEKFDPGYSSKRISFNLK